MIDEPLKWFGLRQKRLAGQLQKMLEPLKYFEPRQKRLAAL